MMLDRLKIKSFKPAVSIDIGAGGSFKSTNNKNTNNTKDSSPNHSANSRSHLDQNSERSTPELRSIQLDPA